MGTDFHEDLGLGGQDDESNKNDSGKKSDSRVEFEMGVDLHGSPGS